MSVTLNMSTLLYSHMNDMIILLVLLLLGLFLILSLLYPFFEKKYFPDDHGMGQ